jgi:carbon storage regulator
MLVLTRKDHQRIVIGESIVVTVVKINGGSVRLGIEAPPEVPVLRDELTGRGSPGAPGSRDRIRG